MSRIQTLDEITAQLGPPALVRWVNAPYGAAAVVTRIRHSGGVVRLNPSGVFRLILQLSSSQVQRVGSDDGPARDRVRAGSIISSFSDRAQKIEIAGAAETLHVMFSPELAKACKRAPFHRTSTALRQLQRSAAQALVASSLSGSDDQLQRAIHSIAKVIVDESMHPESMTGGLAPGARHKMLELLNDKCGESIPVKTLAETANLSLHHFIKACRQSEGATPHALLMQKRIEWSIELLLASRSPIFEIAMLTGFSSPSHFINAFRHLVGVTPAVVRRAARHRHA